MAEPGTRAHRRSRDLHVARFIQGNLPKLLDAAEAAAREVDPGQTACPVFHRDCRVAMQMVRIVDPLVTLPEPWDTLLDGVTFGICLAAVGIYRAASRKAGRRDDRMAERLAAMDLSAAERRAGETG
jgi:hypothetical protein